MQEWEWSTEEHSTNVEAEKQHVSICKMTKDASLLDHSEIAA